MGMRATRAKFTTEWRISSHVLRLSLCSKRGRKSMFSFGLASVKGWLSAHMGATGREPAAFLLFAIFLPKELRIFTSLFYRPCRETRCGDRRYPPLFGRAFPRLLGARFVAKSSGGPPRGLESAGELLGPDTPAHLDLVGQEGNGD